CGSCKVTATPAGSTTTQTLNTTSWSDTKITVDFPASLTGFSTLVVISSTGADTFTVMAASATAGISASQSSLQFTYVPGGAVPPSQTVSISNSGTGTLTWTATASDPWIVVTPSSDTAPSSLAISVSPQSFSVGTYSGTVTLSANGAASVPISVTLNVV